MAMANPLEIVTPANMLRAKGGGQPALNAEAVARAEETLRLMAEEFRQWVRAETDGLDAARIRARNEGLAGDARAELSRRAHEMKGMGGVYGYPVVGRLGGLLARLMDCDGADPDAVMPLVDAHVDAIRASVREAKDGDTPVGQELIVNLERQVARICAG